MIRFALFGAGRIGKMHADNIAAHPNAELLYVYDLYQPSATETAAKHQAQVAESVEQALNDDQVNAVLIATSTDTHVDLLIKAAKAGKAILCEKPIDLDTDRVNRCWEEIKDCDVPIQIGFNRRFDPSHNEVKQAVRAGDIGELEQLIITSRDPGLAPLEYLKVSGGIFRDMLIHDFDIARFILGEEPVELHVIGSALIDPAVEEIGDIDSAMVLLKTASGKLVHINASRRASYGYDQRIEAFGSAGMVQSNNQTATSVSRYTEQSTAVKGPLLNFFIDRYGAAYDLQLGAFIDAVSAGEPVSPSFEDGHRAQQLADAAQQALDTGEVVRLQW
ncbi:inositol 2-dehydrogenase [Motiliproteus sp. MSK22-1]|uniref:inositol 2-dehydrogenase n=1 Tax=Motiliproteus sp. MSK22-1 TaxID=1897630 RepID=UPI0009765260|nr:inositol 2-dehydrogenase [Motiliproteus sp. MSK22-1]OMH29429.1 inositol 2-dehydrogenase [Motiliproteus sp. MSK22-1]